MKTIPTALIIAFFFSACLTSMAQFKQIAEGPKFEEPEVGFAKILQMKNGNTFYIHVTPKDGINIRIYDVNHSEKIVTHVSPHYGEWKDGFVEGIFEINNDVVVFVSNRNENVPVLYRLVLAGNNGKLKSEMTIVNIQNGGTFIDVGRMEYFKIRKDAYSDNYAVIVYEFKEADREKRLQIIHYGTDHKEISKNYCVTPNSAEGKFFIFMDLIVLGPEKVCAFLFSTNEKYFMGSKGIVFMATIEKGIPIKYSRVSIPDNYFVEWGLARYNAVTKNIYLFAAGHEKKKGSEFLHFFNIIDPITNKSANIEGTGVYANLNKDYKNIGDGKDDYFWAAQDILIHDDGSFTVVYEEIQDEVRDGGRSTKPQTRLSKIFVSNYDKKGALLSGYLVPKIHWIINHYYTAFIDTRREEKVQELYRGNQLKAFYFIDAAKSQYIIFNDTERNNNAKNKFVEIEGVSNCDAFMYNLTGPDIVPKRKYLFGDNANGHTLCIVTVSSYNKTNNTYVTLKLEKGAGKDEMASVVWEELQ